MKRPLLRALGLLLLCTLALEAAFALRVAAMRFIDPQSSSFQRSEAWRLLTERHRIDWSQQWVPAERISRQLERAVIASEDSGFVDNDGVDWDAVEKAWTRDQRVLARPSAHPKIVGASTITQQLAKNMLLSGERNLLRKAQELVITLMLDTLLSKQRILEIYLNDVEWGEGVFGAEAAAQHYFRIPAARLGAEQAARLAVMLPAPKRFEKHPASPYIVGRAATIVARMPAVEIP